MNQLGRLLLSGFLFVSGSVFLNCAKKKELPLPSTTPMVLVPAGHFQMGSTGYDPDESPPHELDVAAFSLDQTSVTAKQYAEYLEYLKQNGSNQLYQAAFPDWGFHSCNYDAANKRVRVGKENHPINCVTWFQASNYCEWAHKRLPTEVEREYAARGPIGATFPWGNEPPTDQKVCFKEKIGREGTCPVAQYPKTLLGKLNDAGIADLAGNVWEWTSSASTQYPEHKLCNFAEACIVKDGSWGNDSYVRLRSAARYRTAPQNRMDVLGFRCAK